MSIILILGLGKSGYAAAHWYRKQGIGLRIVDTRVKPTFLEVLNRTIYRTYVDYHLGWNGIFDRRLFIGVKQIVLSPSVSPHRAPFKALIEYAQTNGIDIVSEVELFARALMELAKSRSYRPSLLAVTGTNGKTTVVMLAQKIVAACGLKVCTAGNIGVPALSVLMQVLDSGDLPEIWILELSSFQLESINTLRTDAAVILNISQDHLDWHGSMNSYIDAKMRILSMTDIAIINRDDTIVAKAASLYPHLSVYSFGQGIPLCSGDMGLENKGDNTWLTICELLHPRNKLKTLQYASNMLTDAKAHPCRTYLTTRRNLGLRGLHNTLNALAALRLARCLGLDWKRMLCALHSYKGEPHRTEFVCSVSGVDFIDDSKATNVSATISALEGLEKTIVLIAGGQDKGQNFAPLIKVIKQHVRAVVLIGSSAYKIEKMLKKASVTCTVTATMKSAVHEAIRLANQGDAILLSPACASLDMFHDYSDRAQAFVNEVIKLKIPEKNTRWN